MEGFTKITYKGQEIFYVDYTPTGGSKEKTIQLIKFWEEELSKQPPKSYLALVNAAELKFVGEVANILKAATNKTAPKLKKNAFFGLKPVHQALFNFGFALSFKDQYKVFKLEEETKEWLVKD